MHTVGHQLEECGFPNVAEANGLRPTSKLSRPRWGDYERNGDLTSVYSHIAFSHQCGGRTKSTSCPGVGCAVALPHLLAPTAP